MTTPQVEVKHHGYLGIYEGPIEKGMSFIWQPNKPHARSIVTVTRVQDREHYERAIWTCGKVWNDESRFREAVVALDAHEATIAALVEALRECEAEIDGYIKQEYPHDHPVQERCRQRDFAANPARIALAKAIGDK